MTVNNVITEIIRLHQITAGFFKGESGIIKDLDNDKMRILFRNYRRVRTENNYLG